MKKHFKLIFIFLLLIPYIIYASSYSLESDNANNYILRSTYVNTYQRYLLDGYKFSNIPFNYENQSDSTFRFGGLLSKKEYDISVRNGKTYLYDGSKYWTLTPDGDDKHYTVTYGGLASKDNGDTAYYSRATEFVKKDTVVKGSGTINDPWTFDPFYNVKFVLEDDTKASFGSEEQNQLVRASCLGPGCEASITINSLNGNIYLSNDCHGTYNNETKKFTVSKVGRDLTCKIKFGVGLFELKAPGATPEKFYVRFKENYYKDSGVSNVLTTMDSVPSKTCYDFTGYKYKEYDTMLIKSNKSLDRYFVDKITENATLEAQFTAHSYNITYDPKDGLLSSTTPNRKYGEPLYIPTPTKSGYTFKGWSFTGIDSTAKRGDSSTNIATTMAAGTPYTNNYYQDLKCGNGTVEATANWDSCLITVTLDKNGGTGGTTTVYEKYNTGWYSNSTGTTATTFVTKPSKSGSIFKGYYTQPNGGGIKVIDEDGNILSNNKILGTGTGSCPGATLYANYDSASYTITFYQGNGTSTAGVTQIGSQTCTYGSSCTLKKYADLGTTFPLSTVSGCNYTWSFGGWSTTQTGTSVNYTNNQTFTYDTAGNINLYALGTRNLSFAKGKAPISYATTLKQTWNPYSTADTYVTEVTIPEKIDISGWTFIGFKAGSGVANATVTYSASDIGTKKKPGVTTCKVYRSVYKRDNVTLTYNGNGNTGGSTAASKLTQYYNSGIPNNGTNTENKVSVPSFTLATNGFTKTGYTFSKWASISTSGTQYAAGATYTGFVPTVDDTTINQNMYAIWTASYQEMQNWAGCDSLNIGSTITLRDNRDDNTYTIAKLDDGLCWMTTNLKLRFTNLNTPITSSNTNNPTSTFISASNNLPTTTLDDWVDSNEGIGRTTINYYYTPNNECYGYYNWYTATAGNNNADGDICPKGWHLPTAGDTHYHNFYGEIDTFELYYKKSIIGSLSRPQLYQKLYNLPYNVKKCGIITGDGVGRFGETDGFTIWSSGHWWSNEALKASLGFSSESYNDYFGVRPSYITYGLPVRCIADYEDRDITYKITFDPNGGTSASVSSYQATSKLHRYDIRLTANVNPKRTGYTFKGWARSKTATTAQYNAGNEVDLYSDNPQITLYAVWQSAVTTLQEWNACDELDLLEYVDLTDTRDGNVYTVIKEGDGNCWMAENLRLDFSKLTQGISTSNTNNPTSAFITKANKKPAAGFTCYDEDNCNYSFQYYTEKMYSNSQINTNYSAASAALIAQMYAGIYDPDGTGDYYAIIDLLTQRVEDGVKHFQEKNYNSKMYGALYNYYVASAGNIPTNFQFYNTNETESPGDLCPKGWHMPSTYNEGNLKEWQPINGVGFIDSYPWMFVTSGRIHPSGTTFIYDSADSVNYYYWSRNYTYVHHITTSPYWTHVSGGIGTLGFAIRCIKK